MREVSPETRMTSGMSRRKGNEILRFKDLQRARSPRKKEAKKDGYNGLFFADGPGLGIEVDEAELHKLRVA